MTGLAEPGLRWESCSGGARKLTMRKNGVTHRYVAAERPGHALRGAITSVQVSALKIGQVARRCGVSVSSIRFYERRGVLPAPARMSSGYRVYPPEALARLRVIKALQALGFTLEEIADALQVGESSNASCAQERWRFETVLSRVNMKIAELERLRDRLDNVLAGERSGECVLALVSGLEDG